MKTITLLFVALALVVGPSFAADEKKPCCDPKKDSLTCECGCCKKAADKGKVCKKCHPTKKAEKKKNK